MKTSSTPKLEAKQMFFPTLSPVASAVELLAGSGIEDRGAVFTRREVVDFILDLVGYTTSQELQKTRLLEPSFGQGDFLLPAVERLLTSYRGHHKDAGLDPTMFKNCIRAVELHRDSFEKTRTKVGEVLIENGFTSRQAEELLQTWLTQGDFLLTDLDQSFTHIVGNPPYIRQEMVPEVLMTEYRRRYETIFDRADIYIPFIEYSLKLLDNAGTLGFICADRWMKNRYGGPLRELIATQFHLRAYVDMVGTPAFHSEVIAYPAITIIANEPTGPTYVAERPEIDPLALHGLAYALAHGDITHTVAVRSTTITHGDGPWTLDESDSLTLIRRLENDFPSLEEAGCKVGIGVATGADTVFIAPFETLDVESDRKLPLAMTKDIQSGKVTWRGYGIVNPFGSDGKVVSLDQYPRLRTYLKLHEATIRNRHVSKKNPNAWYRTIDRIYPELAAKQKLLIPDIKGDAHIVYEEGHFYPHHNLYHITSDTWDLQALRAVLLSGIARLFVGTYSTRMHGDFLRFQAQYLRRIRVPYWDTIPDSLRTALREAAINDDPIARDESVFAIYNLSVTERATLRN